MAATVSASKLVAHRGYQARYPENSALSLNQAIEAGAVFIELDVQFSADKQPIIYHDTHLQRVSGVTGAVKRLNRQQLLGYSAYEPGRLGQQFIDEKIAPLETLVGILQANPQVTAFVELKEESIEHCGRDAIIHSVQNILQPVAAQSVIMSFDYQLASMTRETQWPQVGAVLKNCYDLEHAEVLKAEPDYIFINHLIVAHDFDFSHHSLLTNAKLVTYEVGNRRLAYQLLERGVDMLETFDIVKLLKT